jgi:hypothetical protein
MAHVVQGILFMQCILRLDGLLNFIGFLFLPNVLSSMSSILNFTNKKLIFI